MVSLNYDWGEEYPVFYPCEAKYASTCEITEQNLDFVKQTMDNFWNIQEIMKVVRDSNISYEDAREQLLKDGKISK